jgi:hypothetical protein
LSPNFAKGINPVEEKKSKLEKRYGKFYKSSKEGTEEIIELEEVEVEQI